MIYYQKMIYRQDLRNNPDKLYLFGDNCLRTGLGGQAKEMRGEPNAVGVRTKKKPSMSEDSFFTDDDLELFKMMMVLDLDRPFRHIQNGGSVVIPTDGLGTGLSQLPERAPKLNLFLLQMLESLKDFSRNRT
jgi:hypothetical protein